MRRVERAICILTGLVLSPKKWMDEKRSFLTMSKQYVLSQPSGNTSKLIWPPAEKQQKESVILGLSSRNPCDARQQFLSSLYATFSWVFMAGLKVFDSCAAHSCAIRHSQTRWKHRTTNASYSPMENDNPSPLNFSLNTATNCSLIFSFWKKRCSLKKRYLEITWSAAKAQWPHSCLILNCS